MKLSVIIPAYNEASRIVPTLESALSFLTTVTEEFEVIVVNDGSSDSTESVVKAFCEKDPRMLLHSLAQNSGKGAAVRAGMLKANGEVRLFADADGSTPFEELPNLLVALEQGADVVIGSRAVKSEQTNVETSFHRKFLGQAFNRIVNFIAVPGIRDTQCGFKLFSNNAAEFLFSQQKAKGFSFDVELLFLAQRSGMAISEIPVNWHNVEGSKVNLIADALKMFLDLFKFIRWHGSTNADAFEDYKASKV